MHPALSKARMAKESAYQNHSETVEVIICGLAPKEGSKMPGIFGLGFKEEYFNLKDLGDLDQGVKMVRGKFNKN